MDIPEKIDPHGPIITLGIESEEVNWFLSKKNYRWPCWYRYTRVCTCARVIWFLCKKNYQWRVDIDRRGELISFLKKTLIGCVDIDIRFTRVCTCARVIWFLSKKNYHRLCWYRYTREWTCAGVIWFLCRKKLSMAVLI